MKKRKVFQLNTGLFQVTGIQRVIMDIHEALKEDFETKIIGNIPFNKVNSNLGIKEEDYIKFRNPLSLRNSIVIIHERRLLPVMWILSHIPGLNIRYVYIHHNELYGKKTFSLFPENVIAISDSGIRNLTEYFKIPRKNIVKIHNCVRENEYLPHCRKFDPNEIVILYPAGITGVKRQLEIVDHLQGKLNPKIKIRFAGTGPLYEELRKKCQGDPQFEVLGFRGDIPQLMRNSDFTMLFSKHEGLPIALIEATMTGSPIICNSVGGNPEIVINQENGYIVNSWEQLLQRLNSLPDLTIKEVEELGKNSRKKYNSFNFEKFKYSYITYFKTISESSSNKKFNRNSTKL